ncbi:MAG: transglutaminase domain-containing protein [Acidobacteriota bacterium]
MTQHLGITRLGRGFSALFLFFATAALAFGSSAESPTQGEPWLSPFAATPEIEQATRVIERAPGTTFRKVERLVEAIFDEHRGLHFKYVSYPTLTAGQAFERAEGNCVSLVNLMIAMARSAGLEAYFVEIQDFETFHQVGEVTVRSTHLVAGITVDNRTLTVDFYPNSTKSYRRWRRISDERGTAHYHNAVAAEALLAGRLDAAERHLARALDLDGGLVEALNNRALVTARRGDRHQAIALLQQVLRLDQEFIPAIENLSGIYRSAGLSHKADAMTARALELETRNPFYLLEQAKKSLSSSDLETARHLLKRARRMERHIPDIHLLLGQLEQRSGNEQKAARHFARAVRHADGQSRLFQESLEKKIDKLTLASR